MNLPCILFVMASVWLWCLPVMVLAQVQTPARPASTARVAVVKAQLFAGSETVGRVVELIGREGKSIQYRLPGSTTEGYAGIDVGMIGKAQFDFKYDEFEVFKLANERNWDEAAGLILKAIAPVMPFMDFPSNNAAQPAMEAAGYLYKAGVVAQQADEQSRKAYDFYAKSLNIFRKLGALPWFEGVEPAQLRAVQCLAMMGKADDAAQLLNKLPVCEDSEDEYYGLYWLVQANVFYRQNDCLEALEAVVKSLLFRTKDMNTFPDALLLSAHCYYELNEMFQARDVYYEVARLFENTDWGMIARQRLELIMKNGLTEGREMANYWKTFIDVKEDMNQIVAAYLAEAAQRGATNQTAGSEAKKEIKKP